MDWLRSGNLPSYSPREGFRQVKKATEIRGHRQPQAAELVHQAHPGESKASARRVDRRYAPLLVSAIMAVVISLAVSLVETIVRFGFTPRVLPAWGISFAVAMLVAVPTAVLVAPHAQRLVSRITRPPRQSTRPSHCSRPTPGADLQPPPARRGALGRAPAASGPLGGTRRNYTPTQVTDMKHAQPDREPIPWPADGAEAPQGLELRHLRHFVAVADAGSFTRAAERIFIAQPTLSQQIRRLEQIVGTPLLHRRRDGLRLTTAGGVLLDASRTVLSLVDHEVSRTRQAAGLGQPRLRRGLPPGLPEDLAVKATATLPAAETSPANTQSRAELSASRARIIAAADQTRRRLEHDLHDGIQQRLVWARAEGPDDPDDDTPAP